MLFYLASRIFSSVLTHLYPAYLSYKLLATRPTPLPLLERALKYWTVLGTFTFIEYSGVELLVSWIPLYNFFKLIVLLWLVSPQTDGSTHVYDQVLEPWFASHESEVDGALDQLRAKVYEFVQTRLRALWEMLLSSTALGQVFPQAVPAQSEPPVQPPTMADPVSGPVQVAAGLWHSYGPSVLATGAALFRQLAPAPPTTSGTQSGSTLTGYDLGEEDRPVSSRMSTNQSVIERRRQLEAELASLPPDPTAPPFPIPSIPGLPTPTLFPSSSSSSLVGVSSASASGSPTGLRERTTSFAGPGGRFEEIDSNDFDSQDEDGVGHSYEQPQAPGGARKSWFGWGGGAGGYERVKSD